MKDLSGIRRLIQAILQKYNPCRISNGGSVCADGKNMCCAGCTALNENGCGLRGDKKPISCVLYLCKNARANLPIKVDRVLQRLVARAVKLQRIMKFRNETDRAIEFASSSSYYWRSGWGAMYGGQQLCGDK